MKQKSFYLLFCIPLICASCALKPLTLQRVDNTSGLFKLNGLYYGDSDVFYKRRVFIFYENGVLFITGCLKEQDLNYWKKAYLNLNNYQKIPYWWGVYQVDNNGNIELEKWYSTDYEYPTVRFRGKVVNDTTLLIAYPSVDKLKSTTYFNDFSASVVDTFQFVPLSPKPDSTNNFIK